MFFLIWATLLFSLRGISSNSGASVWRTQHCQSDYCVSLYENIPAEAGLCVEISCSFTTNYYFTPTNLVWYKCGSSKSRCGDSDIIFHTSNISKIHSGFEGRVSLLQPDLRYRDCSIMINNLQESDSGSYQLRVNGNYNGKASGFAYNARTTVYVTGLKQKPTLMVPPLTEGHQTTLTCTAPGLCSGSPPNITWRWRGEGEEDFTITGNITAVTQRHSSTLTFNPSAEHHSTNITCKISFTGDTTTEETVTLKVTYKRQPQIIGETTFKEGEDVNLTCSVESFPPSLIKWTKHPESRVYVQTDTGSASLLIPNVTTEGSGRYICTAEHLDENVSVDAEVAVTWFSKILKGSGCVLQSEVLTCMCVSEGFPLPTITWSLLKNHTDYSVTTKVLNHTVNSSITISHHGNISVECFSSNKVGRAKENLIITDKPLDEGNGDHSGTVAWSIAAASLTLNAFCLICMWLLWNK